MFARKYGRQFQKSKARVAAEQFEERQLMTAAVVDWGWFSDLKPAVTTTQAQPRYSDSQV